MAAHRYWQLEVSAVNGDVNGYLSMAQIHGAIERNGADQFAGATITASSTGFSLPPSNLNDGSRSTIYHSATSPTPHRVTIDLGAGNDKDIGEIRILPRSSNLQLAPKDFKLRSSDDNLAWTDEFTVTGYTGWASTVMTAFQTAGCPAGAAGALFWRWNFTDSDAGGAIAGTEAQMHTSIGGADVISSTTDFFNASSSSGGVASNLFDNNTSTLWSSTGTEIANIEIECSQKRAIEEVSWTARTDGGLQVQAPRAFTIDYSYDRRNWTTHISVSGSGGWAAGETRTFSGGASASTWVPQVVAQL